MLKADEAPTTFEDFLKPELKGKKFVLDIKPNYLAGLVPVKGMEWALDYARKLAAQNPIWARGQSRMMTAMAAGEYSLTLSTYYNGIMRLRKKGITNLEPTFLNPISIRMSEAYGVRKEAKHPYAALLLLEFMASPEGQRIIDNNYPGKASVFAPGSKLDN